MSNYTRKPLTVLVVLLAILSGNGCGGGQPSSTGLTNDSGGKVGENSIEPWYHPTEADFRPEFDSDTANQAKQTWPQYWEWVLKFYGGTLFVSGWTAQGQEVLAVVTDEARRSELRADLNRLGRQLATEWGKDNGVRKVDTTAVRSYASRLQAARKADDGSGSTIRTAVEAVRADVGEKLGRP